MCVESCKSGTLTRAEVIASFAGASLLAFGRPAVAQPDPQKAVMPSLDRFGKFSPATLLAFGVAGRSQLIASSYLELQLVAAEIGDPKLREDATTLIGFPVPQYAARLRSAAAREKLREELLQAAYIEKIDAIDAFLPSAANDFSVAQQPFIATAGSGQDSHHAYPGGLVMHELFNARAAIALAEAYDHEYFGGAQTISRDVTIAAALYHDVMKTVVFQWSDDGKLSVEPNIAGTGAHHILSAAEAIARGHDARFVTVVLSAHAAPSLGDEIKVIAWARAAAMVAGVDPVDFGLLKRKGGGFELAAIPPIEAFINNLSDHDYVLSVHAMHEIAPRVDAAIARGGVAEGRRLWYRNALLANATAVSLYQTLAQDERKFHTRIDGLLSKVRLDGAI
jgi:hypothetical protein